MIDLINFSKIKSDSGTLSFVQNDSNIPFNIKRIFYMYDIPSNSYRGAHAHKTLKQIIIPISGSFNLSLESLSGEKNTFFLNRPSEGVYVPPMTWTYLENFSSGAIVLVLASDIYDENDYIRSYKIFNEYK